MQLWFIGAVLAILVGAAFKFGFRRNPLYNISAVEFLVGMVACMVLVTPVVNHFGVRMAKANLLRYDEFWGGFEEKATDDSTPCTRDGPCDHEYDCDPYNHPHDTTTTDSKGNSTTTTTNHTHYHSCPYATTEHDYSVGTTLGSYTIATGVFEPNPREWRAGSGIPGNVARGAPPFWTAAAERIRTGKPGPVTAVRNYDNFILASSRSILKKFSGAVEKFDRQKLLPLHTANLTDNPIRDHYHADKVSFVGSAVSPDQRRAWQDALMAFNAVLGTARQGDLHVVVIDAGLVDPDEYTGALNAYWQSPRLGKRALSKNGIGIVLGAADGKVAWARAFTGMPTGNERMVIDLRRRLQGAALDPNTLFGGVTSGFLKGKITTSTGWPVDAPGIVGTLFDTDNGFRRVSMRCSDKGENCLGFQYLSGEIEPTTGQKWAIALIGTFLSALVWAVLLFTAIGEDAPLHTWWARLTKGRTHA